MSPLLEFLLTISGGPRQPSDPFFADGNKQIIYLKKYGIRETDNEDFLHEAVFAFKCNEMGCKKSFDTIYLYEQHYNLCHRFSCIECRKTLSTAHLLDLHVSESHDSFFAVQAEKKPMYACFAEECKEVFSTVILRKDHCIQMHKFPPSFWSDQAVSRDKKGKKQQSQKKRGATRENLDTKAKIPDENSMEIDEKNKKTIANTTRVLGAAAGRRQKIFLSFTKDLSESLPES